MFLVEIQERSSIIMQDYPTIIGIIDMRLRGISYEDCCGRYKVGHSTVASAVVPYREGDDPRTELPI